MKDWPRGNMVRATAGAAIAVPMTALATGPGTVATVTGAVGGGDVGSPAPGGQAGPVMFCVPDARSGTVSILYDTGEVVMTDRQLVIRVLPAAAAPA